MLVVDNFNDYLTDKLEVLDCNDLVKSYIVSIFDKYKHNTYDYSNRSITLLYSDARNKQDFALFQNVGDYLFFMNSIYPEALNAASNDYYLSVARLSYYSCYRILRDWKVYEQLADDFLPLSLSTREVIREL